MSDSARELRSRSQNGPPELEAVSDLVIVAGGLRRKTVVVAGGERVQELLLVEAAQDHGIVDRVILVGNEERTRQAVRDTHVEVAAKDIIPAADQQEIARATVELAREGTADIVIKGESIERTYFIAGAPNQVDPVIERLLSEGLLVDIVYAIMTL